MIKIIRNFFSVPWRLALLNSILCIAGIVGNHYYQAFCRPSLWAGIVLVICMLFIILTPFKFVRNSGFVITGFLAGVSSFVFLYCVIFLAHINLYAVFLIPFFGIGLALFAPHFFIIQLFTRFFKRSKNILQRRFFIAGFSCCILVSIWAGINYRMAINSIDKFEANGYTKLKPTYMNEKILGMHFIYHTKYCEYDGWRPPRHEPLLVLGMWWNGMEDPLGVDLEKRLSLYKKFFPDYKYKFDCSCAVDGSLGIDGYHKDDLWW